MIFSVRTLTSFISGCCMLAFAGCGSAIPSSGPRASSVMNAAESKRLEGIHVIELDSQILGRLLHVQKDELFSELFADANIVSQRIGNGDVLEVAVWEVPPALFGGVTDLRGGNSSAHGTIFPEQMVSEKGTILIPFVGSVRAAGYTAEELQKVIIRSLEGKANKPQVLVRIVRNATTSVTVVGEVANSARVPLTAKRERLLDVIAAAGGSSQPVGKMTVQITRKGAVHAMPYERIIRDSRQNIVLMPDDIITLYFKPLSFTALGAAGRNAEVEFEAQGISLAQALGRVGGVQEDRANPRGVFVFRFEEASAFNAISVDNRGAESAGKVPVVYRIDMKDPGSYFLAQSFMMHDKDILFVSHASTADLKKFLSLVVSVVYPIENFANFMNLN